MTDLHDLANILRNMGEPPASVDYLLANPRIIPECVRPASDGDILARSMDAFADWIAAPQEKL